MMNVIQLLYLLGREVRQKFHAEIQSDFRSLSPIYSIYRKKCQRETTYSVGGRSPQWQIVL